MRISKKVAIISLLLGLLPSINSALAMWKPFECSIQTTSADGIALAHKEYSFTNRGPLDAIHLFDTKIFAIPGLQVELIPNDTGSHPVHVLRISYNNKFLGEAKFVYTQREFNLMVPLPGEWVFIEAECHLGNW